MGSARDPDNTEPCAAVESDPTAVLDRAEYERLAKAHDALAARDADATDRHDAEPTAPHDGALIAALCRERDRAAGLFRLSAWKTPGVLLTALGFAGGLFVGAQAARHAHAGGFLRGGSGANAVDATPPDTRPAPPDPAPSTEHEEGPAETPDEADAGL